jgi:hypothetical protein
VTISDGGGENRRLELEFVLPSKRIMDMDTDRPSPLASSLSSSSSATTNQTNRDSRTIDLKANPPNSGVPFISPFKKPGGTGWMD